MENEALHRHFKAKPWECCSKTHFDKKHNVMEKGRSEAPRGMLFEVILESLGRQFVKNGGFQNFFFVGVFWTPKRGRRPQQGAKDVGGVGPFN